VAHPQDLHQPGSYIKLMARAMNPPCAYVSVERLTPAMGTSYCSPSWCPLKHTWRTHRQRAETGGTVHMWRTLRILRQPGSDIMLMARAMNPPCAYVWVERLRRAMGTSSANAPYAGVFVIRHSTTM
jgi:hypothetical protein